METQHSLEEEEEDCTRQLSRVGKASGPEGEVPGAHERAGLQPASLSTHVKHGPSSWVWFMIATRKKSNAIAKWWPTVSPFPRPKTEQAALALRLIWKSSKKRGLETCKMPPRKMKAATILRQIPHDKKYRGDRLNQHTCFHGRECPSRVKRAVGKDCPSGGLWAGRQSSAEQ